jgi:CRISPR type III-A-associated protein Csm2
MLKAKANVAYQRGHINTNFKMFIEGNIDYIKDDMDKFNIFVTFFEAVVAYSKGILKD